MRKKQHLRQVMIDERLSLQRARRIRKKATGLRVNRQKRFGTGGTPAPRNWRT